MRRSRLHLAVWGFAIGFGAAVLGGCASAPPARPPISPEAVAARERLVQQWEQFHDLRSLADVKIRRGNRTQRFSGVILLKAPSALRVEALSPLGTPMYVVAGDATALTVWEVFDQKAYILPATPEASQRWLGLAMGADDVVALLAGRARPLADPQEVELLAPDESGPSLSLRADGRAQRIWFDPVTGQAREVQWSGGKNPARAVFTKTSSDSPPEVVTLSTQDGKLEVSVKYRDPKMNTDFDAGLLKLTVPEHVRIQDFR
jgi:outer membrane lipoprotein-sorting protein